MIPFNKPLITGNENKYIQEVFSKNKYSGDGGFTQQCHKWLEGFTGTKKALLTTSCTHATEIAAILLDIQPGDEVIMPSYTFVSTANPFALRGAKIVFVDVRPDTMNIDERKIEAAITPKTKAIVPVHYAGVSCDMDTIMQIAEKHKLWVVEDAAQGIDAYYKGKHLGAIGHLGCLSFHETKNIHCGEGGALLINDPQFIQRAEIIREKGTNRSRFLRGEVDKYTWVDVGSSYLPSELNAAFLLAQFEAVKEITQQRVALWDEYYKIFKPLAQDGFIEISFVPEDCMHNGHLFFIKLRDIDQRQELIDYLKANGIYSVFHYIPLHSAEAGEKLGIFAGQDEFTTLESERLLRLPMYYDLKTDQVNYIKDKACSFFA
ncbi:MAG TPA: dTDP-4-amino-4,6-dideoxygalactose transaminase [Cytophagales bacterium]|nr:dTDP-4-amino-4,6-dideoxygalactose transaminase [Cytophagales bacterium]